jgi:integrase
MLVEAIGRVPIINDSEFVFSENGRNSFNGWSRSKNRLDGLIAEQIPNMPDWQHRDLRRTARTLMARAGVSTEVAEHCLGHTMPSIRRTYDRHDYALEKRDAFDRLAKLLSDILAG